jgi:hypothetical protein
LGWRAPSREGGASEEGEVMSVVELCAITGLELPDVLQQHATAKHTYYTIDGVAWHSAYRRELARIKADLDADETKQP